MTAPGREFESMQPTATGMLAASELARGDLIAQRYRIEEMLGIGGMGVVYRALDLQLDVPVALKLLRPELASRPDAFARFRQELLLARQVSSPHVVRIHDLVQHGSMWLISMDYVPGASLEKRLDREGSLDAEAALGIVRQVALGLTAAHDRGVVHRDLKPANILVTDDGAAYISDFGVARSAAQTGITGTGVVVGTPEYLSPEQARADRVDGRSDLYTLGLILYELIAGKLPFHGSTAAESLAQRIVRAPPPLRRAKPDVAGWIDSLCGRLLALKPAHRLPHARAVVDAIDRRRVAPPPGLWPRRLALIVLIGALAGLGYWVSQRVPVTNVASTSPGLDLVLLPVRPPADADDAARAHAAGLSTWLWSTVSSSPLRSADPERMQILLRQLDFDAEGAARNGERIRESLPSERLLAPQLERDGDGWRLRITEPGDESAATLEIPLDDAPSATWSGSAALLGTDVAPPSWPGREALVAFGNVPDSARDAPAALASALAHAPTDPTLWRAALAATDRLGQPNASATLAERALQTLANDNSHAAAVARGHAHLLLGDAEAAAAEFDAHQAQAPGDLPLRQLSARARADLEGPGAALAPLQDLVRQDPQNARGWFLLGRYTLIAGDARRAVDEYLVRALVIALRIGDELGAAEARNAMGICYERLGQVQAAVEHFTLAADARERLGDTLGAVNSLRNLAAAEAVRGNAEAADRVLDRAGALLAPIDAPLAQADLQNDRGLLAEERGDFRAALVAYRDALALRQASGGDADIAQSQFNVGFAYYQIGEFDNALVYWRQSEGEYARQGDDAGRLRAQQSLALIDSARGAWKIARATLERAVADAETRQMTEEQAVGLSYLVDLDRLQGNLATALERSERSARLFAQREDQRGSNEVALLRIAVLLEAGDFDRADAALDALVIGSEGSGEQRALHALRRAQAALGRGQVETAAVALAGAASDAAAAHSQPIAIETDLAKAQLSAAAGDRPAAQAALRQARAGLERFAPLSLSLLAAETAARLGDVASEESAIALLRRAPDYGRAYAIHHAFAHAHAAAGDPAAAEAARERWRQSRDSLRARLPASLQTGFDLLPHAQDPITP